MDDDQGAPAPSEPEGRRLDRLNRWLTLAANIGVLLGLIVLIFEVRQNADLARATLETAKNDQLAAIELNLAAPASATAWVKSIRAPETLTDAEVRMLESHLVAVVLQWDNMLQLEAAGLAKRSRVESHIRNVAPFYFGSPFGKRWWIFQMPGWEGTAMQETAGPIVDAVDEDFLAGYIDGLRFQPAEAAGDDPAENP